MSQGPVCALRVALSLCVCLLAVGRAHAQPEQTDSPAGEPVDPGAAGPAEGAADGEGASAAEDSSGDPSEPSEAAVTEARRRYAQGSEFYRRARYAEAIAEFSEAYSLWPNPTILYALGQAYEGLSEVNRAIETYQRYIDAAPEGDLRREDAELRIEELRGLLAIVHVDVNVEAVVSVDGEPQGSAPGDFRLSTGRHVMEVRADGYQPQTATITIAGGTERTVTFELEPAPVAAVHVAHEPFRFPRPVFYTAVGLTGAGAVVWGAMATTTLVRARRYNDTPGRTNFDRDDARDVASRSNVALGVTGGLLVTTVVIGLLTNWRGSGADDEPPSEPLVTAGISPLQGGALVSARWTR
ncbi:MAG: tetratricopeptide repeat protein [Sandaracinaceae bacterium]|nr:tetratricopeptide repeat protein [Sandaracinaceae bacterium]